MPPIEDRIANVDWVRIAHDLDQQGWVTTGVLLAADAAAAALRAGRL